MATILLIHGALGSVSQVAPLGDLLGDAHDVHLVELEGHGDTPASAPSYVSIDETAAAARAIGRGELGVLPNTPHPFEQVRLPLLAALLNEFFD